MNRGPQPKSISERFWRHVPDQPGADCWEWGGGRSKRGYGHLSVKSEVTGKHTTDQAHRISYRLNRGPIPEGFVVCHACDNPPCVNPDHLFLGSQRDNQLDSINKGRHFYAAATHCYAGHPLSGDNLRVRPDGRRECKTCARARDVARYQRRKVPV